MTEDEANAEVDRFAALVSAAVFFTGGVVVGLLIAAVLQAVLA